MDISVCYSVIWRDGAERVWTFQSAIVSSREMEQSAYGHFRLLQCHLERWSRALMDISVCYSAIWRDGAERLWTFPSATVLSGEMEQSAYGHFRLLQCHLERWSRARMDISVCYSAIWRDGAERLWTFPSATVLSGEQVGNCSTNIGYYCFYYNRRLYYYYYCCCCCCCCYYYYYYHYY